VEKSLAQHREHRRGRYPRAGLVDQDAAVGVTIERQAQSAASGTILKDVREAKRSPNSSRWVSWIRPAIRAPNASAWSGKRCRSK
jgi:hypothetical protein